MPTLHYHRFVRTLNSEKTRKTHETTIGFAIHVWFSGIDLFSHCGVCRRGSHLQRETMPNLILKDAEIHALIALINKK